MISSLLFLFFFFKQKTAYERRIRDWSSDVCSSDLQPNLGGGLNKPIMVALKGQDIAELDRLSREATKIIRTVPGVVDLESSLKANKPTVAVDIDRQLASEIGRAHV